MVDNVMQANAFARAMVTADCEQLVDAIQNWFDTPYRDPTNALDIAVCVQSAMHSAFARKIDAARAKWQLGEAAEWEGSRIAFDEAMRAAVEAIGRQPNPEPRHDPTPGSSWGARPAYDPKWGDPNKRPAIGAGWGAKQSVAA